jgi:hypothetical protein
MKRHVILAGALVLAVVGCGSHHPALKALSVPLAPATPASPTAPPARTASSSPPAAPSSTVFAGCQLGEDADDGTFAGLSSADVGDGDPSYQVTLINAASSAVTVTGFPSVTFSAYGSTVFTANSTVNDPVLMEPGEKWTFPEGLNGSGFPQVSDATFLEATCSVGQVATDSGDIIPVQSTEPTGNQVSHDDDVSTAQSLLASDVLQLTQDSQTLDTDTSLSSDITTMKSDYATEEADYKSEQADSCDAFSSDADGVASDADGVDSDLDGLDGDISALKSGEIAAVQSDLTAVENDLSTLSGLEATPATATGSAAAAASTALSDASAAITWAQGQGKAVYADALSLASTAQDYASSHGCS